MKTKIEIISIKYLKYYISKNLATLSQQKTVKNSTNNFILKFYYEKWCPRAVDKDFEHSNHMTITNFQTIIILMATIKENVEKVFTWYLTNNHKF